MKKIIPFAAVVILAGCAHSQIHHKANTEQYSSRTEAVCLMKAPLPTGTKFTVLGDIKSGKQFYGSVEELFPLMANDARSLGADAIINVKSMHRLGFFAYARPVAFGTAVKLADPAAFDCVKNGGTLR